MRGRNIVQTNQSYMLEYDPKEKKVHLYNRYQLLCLTANCFHDSADGATLISGFEYAEAASGQTGLAKLAADMLSDYLSAIKNGCKLFCLPEKYSDEFDGSSDYRSQNIDRFMLREKQQYPAVPVTLCSDNRLEQLDPASSTQADRDQIKMLLGQTYWAEGADEAYIQNALANSTFVVMRDANSQQIIGFVRAINNNVFSYISDMVVEKSLRRKGYGTLILNKLLEILDRDVNNQFVSLISAGKDDGKDASPHLYGEKFGFVNYDAGHTNQVYFRYIKLKPVLDATPSDAPNSVLFGTTPKEASEAIRVKCYRAV